MLIDGIWPPNRSPSSTRTDTDSDRAPSPGRSPTAFDDLSPAYLADWAGGCTSAVAEVVTRSAAGACRKLPER